MKRFFSKFNPDKFFLEVVENGDAGKVKELVKKGADIHQCDEFENNVLHITAKNNQKDLFVYFLDLGVNVNAQNQIEVTPLMTAAKECDAFIVQKLIEKGADVNLQTKVGNPLKFAVESGDIEKVKLLVSAGASKYSLSNITYKHISEYFFPNSYILEYLLEENVEKVKELVENGADVNYKTEDGDYLIMLAVKMQNIALIKLLLDHKAHVNIKNRIGLKSPLVLATELKNRGVIAMLINAGADINVRDKLGRTPLFISIENGDIDTVEYLVNKGADFNVFNTDNKTVLMYAIEVGREDIVDKILEFKPDLNVMSSKGTSALMCATDKGDVENAKKLIEAGAYVDIKNAYDKTPLMTAIEDKNTSLVKLLVEEGADVDYKNAHDEAPLFLSVKENAIKMTRFLISHGVNLNQRDGYGKSVLIKAIEEGFEDMARLLIDEGCDLNIQDDHGESALTVATMLNKLNLIEYLLKKGADPQLKNAYGEEALLIAVEKGLKEAVKVLLHNGADKEIKDKNGKMLKEIASKEIQEVLSPDDFIFMYAKKGEGLKVLELIEQGAQINQKEKVFGDTLLIGALKSSKFEIAKMLIEKGADENERGYLGKTPLITAAEKNSFELCRLLLNQGADETVVDEEGYKAVDYVLKNDNPELYTIFSQNEDEALLKHALHSGSVSITNRLIKQKIVDTITTIQLSKPLHKIVVDDTVLKLKEVTFDSEGMVLSYTLLSPKEREFIEANLGVLKKGIALERVVFFADERETLLRLYNKNEFTDSLLSFKVSKRSVYYYGKKVGKEALYLFFRFPSGSNIRNFEEERAFFQNRYKTVVEFEVYDKPNPLYEESFAKESLACVKLYKMETLLSSLAFRADFLYSVKEKAFNYLYFKSDESNMKWKEALPKISRFFRSEYDVFSHNSDEIVLKETISATLAKRLNLRSANGSLSRFLKIEKDAYNRTLYFTPIAHSEFSRLKNTSLSEIFGNDALVYELENSESALIIKELSPVPSKEMLLGFNYAEALDKEKLFLGITIGRKKLYESFGTLGNFYIMGEDHSGKTVLLNSLLLSLFYNFERIHRLVLIDLKSGFNRYEGLQKENIEIISRGIKPLELLDSLHEVEAEIYLREEYIVNKSSDVLDESHLFVFIDDLSYILDMYVFDEENEKAKEEILKTLKRIAKHGPSVGVHLIVADVSERIGEEFFELFKLQAFLRHTDSAILRMLNIEDISSFSDGKLLLMDREKRRTDILQVPEFNDKKEYYFDQITTTQIEEEFMLNLKKHANTIRKAYPYLKKTSSLKEEKEEGFSVNFDFDLFLEEENPFDEIETLYKECSQILHSLKNKYTS